MASASGRASFSQFLRQSHGGVGPQGVLEEENVQDVAYLAESPVEESKDLALDHVRIGHGQEHGAGDRANHRRIETGDTRDLNRDLDPASGLAQRGKTPSRQFALPEIPPRDRQPGRTSPS